MSDYDDYFTDDVLLDDQTLAVLDREELKYINQSNNNASPPSKRQKTNNGWTIGVGHHKTASNVPESMPEISLEPDGSYGVFRAASPGRNSTVPTRSVSSTSLAIHSTIPPPPIRRIPVASGQPFAAQNPNPHSTISIVTPVVPPTTSVISASKLHEYYPDIQKQVQQLQQRLEQLSQENGTIQLALKEAQSMRMAKEGEVTVLRKNAEKLSRDHASQISHLRSEKEEVEARQGRMQKEMKEEVERLKTQFVFKQHEQESARKVPSARPRAYRDSHAVITYTPPQLRRELSQEIPFYPKSVRAVPLTSAHPGSYKDPQSPQTKRISTLPGFRNAFDDATPLVSRKRSNRSESILLREPPAALDPFSQATRHLNNEGDITMGGDRDEIRFQLTPLPDVDGDFEMQPDHSLIDEEVDYFAEIPDRKRELNRILLLHRFPPCTTLSIQLLLGAVITPAVGDEFSKIYSTACTRILEVISRIHDGEDWQHTIEHVSQSLISMLPVLERACLLLPLTALLNLMATLIYALPDLGLCALSQPLDAQSSDAAIIVHLCMIISEYGEIERYPSYEALVTEAVRTIGAVSLILDFEGVDKLAYIPKNPRVLANLFCNNQPASFLAESAQLLVLLASHRKLCRHLLSMPDTDPSTGQSTTDSHKIPIIDRLCFYLIDFERKDAMHKDTKTLILIFFSLLSMADADVHTQLVSSTMVIPSLVFFLSHLTSAFWEDDVDLLSASPKEIFLAINTLNQTLFLLHHLVFAQNSFLNLRQKIYAPQHRHFSGLLHMFVVTFGRLSYGVAPEWVDRQGRIDLVSLTDMAGDILDHVVDGPEADLTWQAYQSDTEEVDMDAEMEDLLGKSK